jgi:hypothetical protein
MTEVSIRPRLSYIFTEALAKLPELRDSFWLADERSATDPQTGGLILAEDSETTAKIIDAITLKNVYPTPRSGRFDRLMNLWKAGVRPLFLMTGYGGSKGPSVVKIVRFMIVAAAYAKQLGYSHPQVPDNVYGWWWWHTGKEFRVAGGVTQSTPDKAGAVALERVNDVANLLALAFQINLAITDTDMNPRIFVVDLEDPWTGNASAERTGSMGRALKAAFPLAEMAVTTYGLSGQYNKRKISFDALGFAYNAVWPQAYTGAWRSNARKLFFERKLSPATISYQDWERAIEKGILPSGVDIQPIGMTTMSMKWYTGDESDEGLTSQGMLPYFNGPPPVRAWWSLRHTIGGASYARAANKLLIRYLNEINTSGPRVVTVQPQPDAPPRTRRRRRNDQTYQNDSWEEDGVSGATTLFGDEGAEEGDALLVRATTKTRIVSNVFAAENGWAASSAYGGRFVFNRLDSNAAEKMVSSLGVVIGKIPDPNDDGIRSKKEKAASARQDLAYAALGYEFGSATRAFTGKAGIRRGLGGTYLRTVRRSCFDTHATVSLTRFPLETGVVIQSEDDPEFSVEVSFHNEEPESDT